MLQNPFRGILALIHKGNRLFWQVSEVQAIAVWQCWLRAQQFLYADPIIFGATTNNVNAGAVYGGNLSFTIDRKQFLPAFPMNAFYRVPQTQTNANLQGTSASPNFATTNPNRGVNSYENGLFGFYVSEPTLIDGRQTIDISLNLGAAVTITDATTTVYATFETRGYLVVNSKS